jgi:hypothetical protein
VRRRFIFFAAATYFVLVLASLATIVAVYGWLASPSCSSWDAATRFEGLSYSPLWSFQLNMGLIFSLGTFVVALGAARRRRTWPPLMTWLAVATSATIGGALLGLSTEELVYGGCRSGGWLTQDFPFATGIAAPLLVSDALVSRRRLPAFVDLIGKTPEKTLSTPEKIFGLVLLAITLLTAEMALRHIFYPGPGCLPLAGLTMSVAPFLIVALMKGKISGSPPLAEGVFAGLITLAALHGAISEGSHNWRTLWTSAVFLLLARYFTRRDLTPEYIERHPARLECAVTYCVKSMHVSIPRRFN